MIDHFTIRQVPERLHNSPQRLRPFFATRFDSPKHSARFVDETRALERCSTWDNPADYARCVSRSYRRDFWNQRPVRCEVWSEKGTVRGVLAPVLDQYAVGFRVMQGFSGATTVYDVAQDDGGRELIALYVGGNDPSGMFMSDEALRGREPHPAHRSPTEASDGAPPRSCGKARDRVGQPATVLG